ncbi:ribosomal protein S5 domain 2-type protein [Thamnocephalis sphaerospora]|uniref:Ribosomal RNA-processing protein 41 n=1 Tax=Thamnocephalis sphaerospora TaxID=78915 RepID=A0A4P9XPF4_9FUNG|nr:ribosomal protein S5 domain 2-type protein [Thamnocephalis sphaerospora]|eukprot:RKP07866.1 ribosomal protein S5 domain 2-type protein [Thamnocephalis sphaerospora]
MTTVTTAVGGVASFLLFFRAVCSLFIGATSFAMSRVELLNPEGLRVDGRRANELRKLSCKLSPLQHADGSAYIEQGNTKVLAVVYGPRETRHRAQVMHDRAYINVEYLVAPFSAGERKKRSKNDKRLLELALAVKQTFDSVVMTTLHPRSQIDIYLQVLQDDGGALQASINAATLALVDAGVPMVDYVCACTGGCVDSQALLDLNHIEESSAETPDLTVAILPRSGKVTLLQMTSRVHSDQFEQMLNLAMEGCRQVHAVLDSSVRDSMQQLADQMTHR